MVNSDELAAALEEFIDVTHFLVKDLEKLVAHVGQVTPHFGYDTQLSLIASELSGLHQRVQRLRGTENRPPRDSLSNKPGT
jgi:hypothetical protein